jgi:two-component system, NtrC family, sensor kinase
MKLKIASIAFLFSSLATGFAWLTLQPLLFRLMEAVRRLSPDGGADAAALSQARALLPFYLALDLLGLTLLFYAVLHWMLVRPLQRTEEEVEQLQKLHLDLPLQGSGGPLLSRVRGALGRLAEALRREQVVTRNQLTDLRASNERLAKAQTELVAAERLATVGRLAAGVAHEVGNPLAGILGYLSLARSRLKDSPELLDYLTRIDQEVQRIDQIVRGLLDLGRPSRETAEPVDVAKIAETCARLVGAGAPLGDVQISLNIAPGTVARAQPGLLSQVLLNLLLNAGQALEGRGKVDVQGEVKGDAVVLKIQDSGPGIPPEVLPHIFEPFFTTKGSREGTGLGLAVCLHLVTSMGGKLSAANGATGGACFTVELPVAST